MKNKIYKFLLPAYTVLCILLFVGITYVADDYPQFASGVTQFFVSLLLCAVGSVIGAVIHFILHELGHLLPLINKSVIMKFSVLGVTFTKTEKGYKPSIKKSEYGGEVVFVGKNPNTAGALVFTSCLVAWVSTLLTLIVFAFLFYFSNSFVWYCLLGGATVSTFYSLLLNFLSGMPSSDGILLFNPKKHVERIFSICETESRLMLGESFLEMPDELFYSENNRINSYYSYLRLLEKGDLSLAKELLDIAVCENEKTRDNQRIALDLEKFYLALAFDDNKIINELEDVAVDYCDANVNPTTLRIMIKYRAKRGDVQWETVLRTSFETCSKKAFKGLFKAEKTICDKFS